MPNLIESLALALDPVLLAKQAGFEPDPWQIKMLRSPSNRLLLNCSRQSGKSSTTAVKAVHTALFTRGALVLLLSPTLRQSSELFRKCLDVYRCLDHPVAPTAESALRIELENGSRIVSLPGKEGTVRGLSSPKLIIIDEASRVSDELYTAVRPMLAVSNGKLILLSTPWGKRGFFFEAYQHRHEWEYYEVLAPMCPRISPSFLEEEKSVMGEFWFNQEYLVQFLDSEGAAFREEDIARIIQSGTEVWDL